MPLVDIQRLRNLKTEDMTVFMNDLPIEPLLPDIAATLKARRRLILGAPPGAGKTTRVPLALAGFIEGFAALPGKIIMLEPRRLAARAAAERMADLLGERVGDRVGFRIRGARKIGPHASRLYAAFLTDPAGAMKRTEPNPGKIDRIFAKAVERRTRGRPGLYMQSRFPNEDWENGVTAAPYSVFQGFTEIFENFEPWLAKATGARVHGHLFHPDSVEYAEGQTTLNGALSNSAAARDYNANAFLTNLIWNTRGERQCFQFGPADNQKVIWRMARSEERRVGKECRSRWSACH